MTNTNTDTASLYPQQPFERAVDGAVKDDLWITKPIQFKFLLGEIPLFVLELPGLVFNAHFTNLTNEPDEIRLPLERLSSELEAILVRSHPVDRDLQRIESSSKVIRYVPTQYRRYYIDLEGSFTDYLNKFSAKSRSTLQRKVRKFAEFSGGEIEWREFKYPDEMEEFYRQARDVSQKTYQERLLNSGLPENDEFRQELRELSLLDSMRGYLLYHEAKPIAYLYCPIQDDILLYRYLGYDPEFKQWSPGTVLQHIVLEKLFAEGRFRMFDFTEGQGPHKEFFATGNTRCADLYFFRPTLRNLLLLKLHSGLNSFSAKTVKTLDRIGLKSKIKKLIRAKG